MHSGPPRSLTRAALVLIAVAVPGLAGRPGLAESFFPNPVFDVGPNSYGLVMADIDGDGILDLVTSSFDTPGSLSILRGRGDGTFAAEVRLPTGGSPQNVLPADLNDDGRPDLVLDYESGAAIFLNRGNGTFGPEVPVVSDHFIDQVTVGDFDGDGLIDLLATLPNAEGSISYQVFFGEGDGTFIPATEVVVGFVGYPEAADVNGDGRSDILTLSFGDPRNPSPVTNDLLILVGNGDGTFLAPAPIPLADLGYIVLPDDLNGDGRADLTIGTFHFTGDYFVGGPGYIFYGRGDGSFGPGPVDALQPFISDLDTGDLNRDGTRDFIELGAFGAAVHLGRGDGTFSAGEVFNAGADSVRLAIGDLDGDVFPDLVVLANAADGVFTFAGNGDGTFGPPILPALRSALFAAVASGDFNGDGRLDLAAGRVDSDKVSVLLGLGDGSFGPEVRYPAGDSPSAVAVFDFDRDGRLDLAVAAVNWHDAAPFPVPPGSLSILRGLGDGTFGPATAYDTGPYPVDIALSDLDGDGNVDLAVLNGGGGYGGPADVSVFLGRGDGTFLPGSLVDVGPLPSSLAIADFNRDGHPDLAVGHRGSFSNDFPYAHIPGDLSLLIGNGDGTFQGATVIAEIFSPSNVAAADLNSDGSIDLVVADEGLLSREAPGGVLVFLGHGDGTFAGGALAQTGAGPQDLTVADFNGDGRLDVASANNFFDTSILLGLGNGRFDPQSRYGLFGLPAALISGDFNGDLRQDLLVASSGGVFILTNRGGVSADTRVLDLFITVPRHGGEGTVVLTWRTDRETDLAGFNVVTGKGKHRRLLNPAPIPCHECTSGRGSVYEFIAPQGTHGDVFLEVVHRNGRVVTFGPAKKRKHAPRAASPPGRTPVPRTPPGP